MTGVAVDGSGGAASARRHGVGRGRLPATAASLRAPGATLARRSHHRRPPPRAVRATLLLDGAPRCSAAPSDAGGSVHLGGDAVVEPGALVRGPAVIGARCVVRPRRVRSGARLVGADVSSFGIVGFPNVVALEQGALRLTRPGGVAGWATAPTSAAAPRRPTSRLFDVGAVAARVASGARVALGRSRSARSSATVASSAAGSVTDPGTFIAPNTHASRSPRLRAGASTGPARSWRRRQVVERAPLLQ